MRAMAKDKQGRPLPSNTYHTVDKTGSYYRYKQTNGKLTTIRDQAGKVVDYELACLIAERANQYRGNSHSSIKSLTHWIDKYIVWAEKQDPVLLEKRRWKDTKTALIKFGAEHSHVNIDAPSLLDDVRPWWDGRSHHAQKNIRSAFSKFFQWCMSYGVCSINPFNTSDNAPKLLLNPKPDKKRAPLEKSQFWAIYHCEKIKKYPHVKIAMAISVLTGWREEDICLLEFDKHLIDDHLNISIGKSINQRGDEKASHNGYDLGKHYLLKKLVNEARELSLRHRRCPFILSYHSKRMDVSLKSGKSHVSQVTPDKLSRDFAAVRDSCDLSWPKDKNPASFHEVKGLFCKVGLDNYQEQEVQQAAAHVDSRTTKKYKENHAPDFKPVNVVITEEMIGGKL